MPDIPLANESGQIDREALRARINAALKTADQPRPVYRIRVERVGNEVKVTCPCGKSRLLGTQHINVFCRALDLFLGDHSWCEPGDAA